MALMYYARTRFIVNLLPQLRQAGSPRRVVTVAAGGKESPVFPADLQASNLGMLSFRPHATSMVTLSLLAIAKHAPGVSFVHVYPGFVKTGMSRELTGVVPAVTKVLFAPVMAMLQIPIEETGERQLDIATSAGHDGANGIPLGPGVQIAVGTDGKLGGGVYSIDYEGEGTNQKVQSVLEDLVNDGTAEKVWSHTEEVFKRITCSTVI